MGLALVGKVFVDGNDVNLSLCFVEGLDSPIQEDVVARE
jgi:hypothetical protein